MISRTRGKGFKLVERNIESRGYEFDLFCNIKERTVKIVYRKVMSVPTKRATLFKIDDIISGSYGGITGEVINRLRDKGFLAAAGEQQLFPV